jgi:tRNA dimethylallyltransferase
MPLKQQGLAMISSAQRPLILLAGPTATGKTALAVALARRLGAEIVSADSMQIYRGCAIGTAQPTTDERQGVAYHLVDRVDPGQAWSVADWLRATLLLIDEIRGRGKAAIVAGGTGLYFKALSGGLFEAPQAGRHRELRRRLEAEWDGDGGLALRRRLEEADPEAARRIDTNDRLRVVRALEVYEATGRPMTVLQQEARNRHRALPAHRFVLCLERERLYRRIDARVAAMMEKGFAEEVRDLLSRGAADDWPAMRALGYAPMARLVRGEIARAQAVEETRRLSRRYAKQQMVLLRNWPGAVWLDAAQGVEKNVENIEKVLELRASDGL